MKIIDQKCEVCNGENWVFFFWGCDVPCSAQFSPLEEVRNETVFYSVESALLRRGGNRVSTC